MPIISSLLFVFVFFLTTLSVFADTKNTNVPLASGYGTLSFEPPEAGSYRLYTLGKASNGNILDADAKKIKLYQLFDNKIVLMGFVYLSCSDVNGCPLTTFVMSEVKKVIDKVPNLKNNTKLLSLSFDPKRDTPKAIKHHQLHIGADSKVWSIITTKDAQQLQPLLDNYNQPIQKIYNEKGKETGEINHILRVFLIDKDKKIRNIYSTAFLHKDILINDIKTLLLEENAMTTFEENSNYHNENMQHHHP